jgi:RuvB-like protein 1 (pontin 52)
MLGYENKFTWHSHVNRLFSDSSKKTNKPDLSGLIAQINARESIRIIINMIKKNKMAGRVIIITGISGSGKTALGLALGKELGETTPFSVVNGSEFSFLNSKKTNRLIQSCRKAIGIRIIDTIEFYEGEVTNILIDTSNNNQSLLIGLKSSEGTLRIKLKESLFQIFNEKNVKIGDIIYIEPDKYILKVIGRSSIFYQEDELRKYDYVTIPSGKVFKKKKIIQDITLNDLDIVNIQQIDQYHCKVPEISDYLRQEVDKLVSKYIKSKKAQILNGVLFIDEAHTLNFDSFCFLTRLLDSRYSPLILLSTNRTTIVNLKNFLDSKIPINFLNRCLIIRTKKYVQNEMANIIVLKAKTSKIVMTGNAIKKLRSIAVLTSLRFSILLSLAAGLISNTFNEKIINESLVTFVNFIFFFSQESRFIRENEKNYLIINRLL